MRLTTTTLFAALAVFLAAGLASAAPGDGRS